MYSPTSFHALIPGYGRGQLKAFCVYVCSWMIKSMIYLAQTLYNPAVKPFTDSAGISSNVQAFGDVCMCMTLSMRITERKVSTWPGQPPTPIAILHTYHENTCNKSSV